MARGISNTLKVNISHSKCFLSLRVTTFFFSLSFLCVSSDFLVQDFHPHVWEYFKKGLKKACASWVPCMVNEFVGGVWLQIYEDMTTNIRRYDYKYTKIWLQIYEDATTNTTAMYCKT